MVTLKERYNEDVDPELAKLLELLRATPARDPRSIVQGEERFLVELDGLATGFELLGRRSSYTHDSPLAGSLDLPASNGFKGHLELYPKKGLSLPSERSPAHKDRLYNGLFAWLAGLLTPGQGNQHASLMRRSLLASIIAVLLLVFGGAGFATAAKSSLPGEALYPLKTSLEQARLSVTANPATQANLYLNLAESRLDEISGLVAAGRYDQVAPLASEFENYVRKAVQAVKAVAQYDPTLATQLNARLATTLSSFGQTLGDLLAGAPDTLKPDLQTAVETSQGALNGEWAIPSDGGPDDDGQGIQSNPRAGEGKGEDINVPQETKPAEIDIPENGGPNEQNIGQDGCKDSNGDGADDQSGAICEENDGAGSRIDNQRDEGQSGGQKYDDESDPGAPEGEDTHSDEHSGSSDSEDSEHEGDSSKEEMESMAPQDNSVAQSLSLSLQV